MTPNNTKKTTEKDKNTVYKENGNNVKAGKADSSPLPNNPAENAEKTSPEEDKKAAKKK
jgi:hypothetical protein